MKHSPWGGCGPPTAPACWERDSWEQPAASPEPRSVASDLNHCNAEETKGERAATHTRNGPSTAESGRSAASEKADGRPPHSVCCTAHERKECVSGSLILHTLSLYVVLAGTHIASLPPHP